LNDFRTACQDLYLINRGIVKDQRILIYGTVGKGLKNFTIKPEIIIGSGIVEFEELLEFTKNKLNMRLFNLTLCLAGLGVIHFGYKTFKN
jgi:hypothetical protein